KAINSYAIIWTDSNTNQPVSPSNRTNWTLNGPNGGGTGLQQPVAGSLAFDLAHHGEAGYLAYLLTGDYMYLEDMENQSAMCYLINSSTGGLGSSRIFGQQTRAVAWCFRTVMQLAAIGPSGDSIVSDYQSLLASNATHFNNLAHQSGMNPLGFA